MVAERTTNSASRTARALAAPAPTTSLGPGPASVLVVVPVYNESASLERTVDALQDVVRQEGYDLLAVNDASTDGSLAILRAHSVPTVTLSHRLGYGAAVQTGYKYALAKGYEYVIQLDGDGQHDPRFLPVVRAKLEQADVVIGSRFLANGAPARNATRPALRQAEQAKHEQAKHEQAKQGGQQEGGEEQYRGTMARRLGIGYFRMLLRLVGGQWISDPTSGYIGMRRRCVRFLCMDAFPDDFPDADVLSCLLHNRFRLCEVPVRMYRNQASGHLHRGVLAPIWYMFKVTLSLLLSKLRTWRTG